MHGCCFFSMSHFLYHKVPFCTLNVWFCSAECKKEDHVTTFILCLSCPLARCCYCMCCVVYLPVTRALVRTRTTIERYIFHCQRIHKNQTNCAALSEATTLYTRLDCTTHQSPYPPLTPLLFLLFSV